MIANERDSHDDIGYLPSVLLQCCLPQHDPGPIPVWERYRRRSRILIHPWYDWDNKPHYPYGVFPRLLLHWVTWEVLQNKRREILLGSSFSEFMQKFGVALKYKRYEELPSKFRHHLRQQILAQMMSLFCCHVSFERRRFNRVEWDHFEITQKGDLDWNRQVLSERLTPEAYIILGEAFYKEILRSKVPVDMRAIHGLKHSAMALDLYSWATYQTFLQCTKRAGEARYALTTWADLMYQVGASYAHTRQFKAKIPHVLEQVKAVYPELRVDLLPEGLIVHASRPAVQIKERMDLAIE